MTLFSEFMEKRGFGYPFPLENAYKLKSEANGDIVTATRYMLVGYMILYLSEHKRKRLTSIYNNYYAYTYLDSFDYDKFWSDLVEACNSNAKDDNELDLNRLR